MSARPHAVFSLSVERRPIAARAAQAGFVLAKLPLPPGANNLFANAAGRGRVKSERYRNWAADASWRIKAQRPRRLRGPVDVAFTFQDGRARADLDNLAKAPLDLLVALALIESDDAHTVRRLVLQWGAVEGLHVRVQPSRPEANLDG
jgi:crossover junction endodeoxyribonuclease RusA